MAPTRQQRRAKARAPLKHKKRGGVIFLAVLTGILLAGGAATTLLRANPPQIRRGALTTDHWHATYKVELCGRPLAPYPAGEGEIHTHGDGRMHIHPHTPPFAGKNANLGAFFQNVETTIGVDEKGSRFLTLPDGKTYRDGGTCPGSKEKFDLLVRNSDGPIEGDPHSYILHDADVITVRFGLVPVPDAAPIPNPLITEGPKVTSEGQSGATQPQESSAPAVPLTTSAPTSSPSRTPTPTKR